MRHTRLQASAAVNQSADGMMDGDDTPAPPAVPVAFGSGGGGGGGFGGGGGGSSAGNAGGDVPQRKMVKAKRSLSQKKG